MTSEVSTGRVRALGQVGPGGLVVGLDGGPILSERELEAEIGVGVAVGEVMHDLAHGPAAVAIGRVELGLREAEHGRAEALRRVAQDFDAGGAVFLEISGWRREASDGIAEFFEFGHRMNLIRMRHCGQRIGAGDHHSAAAGSIPAKATTW